jgi:hypothetical protein
LKDKIFRGRCGGPRLGPLEVRFLTAEIHALYVHRGTRSQAIKIHENYCDQKPAGNDDHQRPSSFLLKARGGRRLKGCAAPAESAFEKTGHKQVTDLGAITRSCSTFFACPPLLNLADLSHLFRQAGCCHFVADHA